MNPNVEAFFDEATFTITYVVVDPAGRCCAIIDPVLDYDPKSGRSNTSSADRLIRYIETNDLEVEWILETHAHADHLTAAPYLKERLGGTTAIGEHIVDVQRRFRKVFNTEPEFRDNGCQFDHLLCDGEMFRIGSLQAHVLHTPGHTSESVTYIIGDAAFVGDTMFMPDSGTARTDFPGGDAATLYQSIQTILALPDDTRLFMCHDYMSPERDVYAWETTVAAERDSNIHVGMNVSKEEFVRIRNARDETLPMPRLMLPAIQVNMRAGEFPPPESNGTRYLKIPINAL